MVMSGARCRLASGPADATAAYCLLLQYIQIGFTFLLLAHPGSPGQRAVKRVLHGCVAYLLLNMKRDVLDTVFAELCDVGVCPCVALAYVTTGEYPELLRLRIQMLMESGCEGYSLNLISWCVRSPVFEADIAMRATYLLLLHRLGRTDDFHNQVLCLSVFTTMTPIKWVGSADVRDWQMAGELWQPPTSPGCG